MSPSEVVECLRELDKYKSEHKEELDPQLLHYLERRSYQKALAYLQNPDLPHQP